MNTLAKTLGGIVFAAFSAAALDKEFTTQLLESARNIEREATTVSAVLKTRRFDANDVRTKIDAMSGDLAKLQELVDKFEKEHPQLSERDQSDWKLVKDKVQLLEIFHQQKKKLASEDIGKNRSLIRAHSDGVAQRAAKLQKTVAALQRVPLS